MADSRRSKTESKRFVGLADAESGWHVFRSSQGDGLAKRLGNLAIFPPMFEASFAQSSLRPSGLRAGLARGLCPAHLITLHRHHPTPMDLPQNWQDKKTFIIQEFCPDDMFLKALS